MTTDEYYEKHYGEWLALNAEHLGRELIDNLASDEFEPKLPYTEEEIELLFARVNEGV